MDGRQSLAAVTLLDADVDDVRLVRFRGRELGRRLAYVLVVESVACEGICLKVASSLGFTLMDLQASTTHPSWRNSEDQLALTCNKKTETFEVWREVRKG